MKVRRKNENYLFIDGSNLYAAQYELFGPKKYLDFSQLIRKLQKKIKIKFDKIYFYASYSPKSKKPTKKQKLYLKNEALFYRNVKKTRYDTVYLFSGDADFLQALFVIKKFCRQKVIYLLCMENKLMYQGIFYFKTFAISFRKKLMIKRKLKNLTKLFVREGKVVAEV